MPTAEQTRKKKNEKKLCTKTNEENEKKKQMKNTKRENERRGRGRMKYGEMQKRLEFKDGVQTRNRITTRQNGADILGSGRNPNQISSITVKRNTALYETRMVVKNFLVACSRLYKSLCRSVGRSVGRSPFTFFAFFSSFRVDKCIIKYFMSVKQQYGSFFLIFCLIW